MKKLFLIFVLISFICLGVYFLFIYQKGTKYYSPNSEFIIVVKKKQRFFSTVMPGTGGAGSTPVLVILKDKSGKTIGKSSDNLDCSIFDGSINIQWDIQNGVVWYGKGKMFNLRTGKVEC